MAAPGHAREQFPSPSSPGDIPAALLLIAQVQRFSFGSSVNPRGLFFFFTPLTSRDVGELIESGFA